MDSDNSDTSEDYQNDSDNEEMEQIATESENDENEVEESESDDDEKTEIRTELKDMPFEELLKLKNEMGTKDYNEAIFGKSSTRAKISKPIIKTKKKDDSSDNDDSPMEISSKKRVPAIGMGKKVKELQKSRDPRFDSRSGYFNGRQFRKQYGFVNDLRNDEISQLKEKLNDTKDEEERQKLKLLIQRNANKNREYSKLVESDEKRKIEKSTIKQTLVDGKKPYYMKKSTKKAEELVEKYEKLKESGQLPKHIDKRRKKITAKDRKKLDFST